MKKVIMFLLALVMVATASAQMRTVTGTVLNADDGEPLVGASVLPIGGGNGIATDIDGKFSIKVPQSVKALRVSYVGMVTQEVPITNSPMTIKLTTGNKLDEVMVVAFGTTTKQAFTGSAAVVDAEELSKHITTNVADALVGSVPGFQMRSSSGAPGASQGEISIRGISSLYSNSEPLVIVDGAPYEASLSNIPQGDIETISVLKDAASAALYGARGAGGVIIVTTKRGKTKDAVVSVDAKWGVNSRAIQQYDVIKSPSKYYETYYDMLYNFNLYGQGMSAAAANAAANSQMFGSGSWPGLGYNVYTVPQGENLIGLDGKINPNATLGREVELNGQKLWLQPDDWNKEAYHNSFRQEYNVSVNGGTDRASYYSSVNYLDDEGVIDHSSYDRLSARVRADYQAKKWLKLGANIGYVHSKTTSVPNFGTSLNSTNIMYFTSMMAPIYPVYLRGVGADGNPYILRNDAGEKRYDYGVAATNYGLARPFMSNANPLGTNNYDNTQNIGNQLNATLTADINITDYLKFSAQSTLSWGNTIYSSYGSIYNPNKSSINGDLTKYQQNSTRTNNVQTLSFFKNLGPDGAHYLNIMAGHEYYRTNSRYLTATAQGGFSPDIQEIYAFAKKATSSSRAMNYNVEGYFGSAQYNYQEKYFASASYRLDGSSFFAKGHRWGSFWSVGGAWLISKEEFMKPYTWVDMLKLKASIGQQGNDGVGYDDHSYLPNYFYWSDLYQLTPSGEYEMSPTFSNIGNRDITWETTTNFNVGAEFGFFGNRLTGNIDFYVKRVSNLLFWMSVAESAGARGYYGNMGTIRNQGVELSLAGHVIRTRDFEWQLSGNISHNATKIVSLPKAKTGERGGFFESSMWYQEGKPLYNYMTYAYAGVNEQGEALYYYDPNLIGEDGAMDIAQPGKIKSKDYVTTVPGEASRYTVGSILPKVYGGFSTYVRVKDFDLTATFDYQIGGKVYDNQYAQLMIVPSGSNDAGHAIHKDVLKSWSPNNTNSDIPRWQYGQGNSNSNNASDRFLTNASYLNFQSFTVGYTLPKGLIKDITKLRFYVAGENLCFWSARKGFDPRYSYSSNESVAVYSPVRNISGGVQVTF